MRAPVFNNLDLPIGMSLSSGNLYIQIFAKHTINYFISARNTLVKCGGRFVRIIETVIRDKAVKKVRENARACALTKWQCL